MQFSKEDVAKLNMCSDLLLTKCFVCSKDFCNIEFTE